LSCFILFYRAFPSAFSDGQVETLRERQTTLGPSDWSVASSVPSQPWPSIDDLRLTRHRRAHAYTYTQKDRQTGRRIDDASQQSQPSTP